MPQEVNVCVAASELQGMMGGRQTDYVNGDSTSGFRCNPGVKRICKPPSFF